MIMMMYNKHKSLPETLVYEYIPILFNDNTNYTAIAW